MHEQGQRGAQLSGFSHALRVLSARIPGEARQSSVGRMRGELPADFADARARADDPGSSPKAPSVATRKASQEAIEGPRAPPAGADRWLPGRSGGFQSHAMVRLPCGDRGGLRAETISHLRSARVWGHGGDHETDSALHGSVPSLRRHVPHVLGLLPQCSAHGPGTSACASTLFVFTHDSIGLGEDGPREGLNRSSTCCCAAADSQHGRLAPVRHRGVGHCLGRWHSSVPTAHRALIFSRRESAVPVAAARSGARHPTRRLCAHWSPPQLPQADHHCHRLRSRARCRSAAGAC